MDYRGEIFPLENIYMALGEEQNQVTSADGRFCFDNIQPSSYELSISIFKNYTIQSAIEAGHTDVDGLEFVSRAKSDWANKQIAEIDIKNSDPRLLLLGGSAPTIYTNQKKFERKYKVRYYDYGCIVSVPKEKMEEYNHVVFQYLDAKYGNKWRESVRPDVLGLNKDIPNKDE